MKSLLRPACILLYFLSVIVFLLGGMFVAGLTGAGEGQGLAAGAIVLSYGFIAAVIGFIGSLILSWFAGDKTIVRTNRLLVIILIVLMSILVYRFMTVQ